MCNKLKNTGLNAWLEDFKNIWNNSDTLASQLILTQKDNLIEAIISLVGYEWGGAIFARIKFVHRPSSFGERQYYLKA